MLQYMLTETYCLDSLSIARFSGASLKREVSRVLPGGGGGGGGGLLWLHAPPVYIRNGDNLRLIIVTRLGSVIWFNTLGCRRLYVSVHTQ